jgi:RNA polymerase sigma factor (sigma-70 family)
VADTDLVDPNERELLERAKRGDREAQDALCRLHIDCVHAWVRLKRTPLIASRESAMDLVQSAFRQALADLPSYEWGGGASFRNWLLTYAENKLRNRERFHRAERRSPTREADQALSHFYASMASPLRTTDAREQVDQFERAFFRLGDADRDLIVFARIEGLSHAQIAERLGISEANSRKMLSRALVRLANFMQA